MSKRQTIGAHIKDLRDSRGETQAQFAKHLGVKRTAVVGYEHDDPLRKPSPVIYLRLAILAEKAEDRSYFLGLAQITQADINSLAESVQRDAQFEAREGDLIRVPPAAQPWHEGLKLEKGIPHAADLPSLRPQRFFILAKQAGEFNKGDIFFLDGSLSRAGDLRPFWDEIVLVTRANAREGAWEQAVGKLILAPGLESTEGPWLWVAELQPLACLQKLSPFRLGYWEDGLADPLGKIPEELRRERARSALRLDANIQVVGRVVGWLRAQQEKS